MLKTLKNKKIAVLMGGRSSEKEVSLRSGKRVLASLLSQGFDAFSIDLTDDLIAHLKKHKTDIVFIMLHGSPGEDGTVQGMLEVAQIPYTGSKVLASALAMNKVAAKRIFEAVCIPTPGYFEIDANADIAEQVEKIKKSLPLPLVLKPVSEGSSVGIKIIKKGEELEPLIKEAAHKYKHVFVEEYIRGKEVTVGIIGSGSKTQALPILELAPKNEFYDYESKYTSGMTEFILPANLPKPIYEKTQETALLAHKALGCHGVSRVDIIVTGEHIPYVHEVNTIPGMTEHSDLPAEAKSAGISFDELVVKILESAL
ncbi:MAG: D-alanine--D-alanine ligase [Candidatus Margulisiibacteriota bacterium]